MLSVVAQNELVADPLERDVWLAEGDDPYFSIRFAPFRRRYVIIKLSSRGGAIQPKVYINTGRGYREQDAVSVGSAGSFLIVVDVGSFGTICSLRLDPASEPCQVTLRVEGLRSADRVEEYISEQKLEDESLLVVRLPPLPRFWKKLPAIRLRRRNTIAARYMEAASALAEKLVLDESSPRALWLSIVVPVYNAEVRHLNELVESFNQQNVSGIELILSDDGSNRAETLAWFASAPNVSGLVVVLGNPNRGIASATNSGIGVARGEWVALLDHDDIIAPNGLRVLRDALDSHPEANFLYTDELIVNDALEPMGVMLKPAFDPILLSGVNYINHFSVYRRKRLNEIGLLRSGFEGSQDYDLLLRYFRGIEETTIFHIPYPAYWWRRTGATYSRKFLDGATANARLALQEVLPGLERVSKVEPALTETLHRVRFSAEDSPRPRVSIIIPNKDSHALMSVLLRGIYEQTAYSNLEVIVIDNGTTDPATLALYQEYTRRFSNFSFYVEEAQFNFSQAINKGVAHASGEHFLLLNNDIEIVHREWLGELVECLSYEGVGVVGAKLLYPNQRIQHAGVITGFGGLAGHWYLNKPASFGGPMNRLHVRSSMTCVTGAAMLISGRCARQIGHWDEENFAVAYNDVDFCLRAYKAGFRIVWTPFACLIHHESVSRGSDRSVENRKRFAREKENLRRIHGTDLFEDPASNPGFSKDRSDPRITTLSALPPPRRWFI
ncbi:glycosyltransferase [Ensifer sesbaniae]|uniref:glycosyltransferase family 2 protein n=1 Tax=Ensifer sesbaniae TaxID=1214071 RepID=UPI0020015B77|nr:glycosyltransferase [Ensifer sesbaniae]